MGHPLVDHRPAGVEPKQTKNQIKASMGNGIQDILRDIADTVAASYWCQFCARFHDDAAVLARRLADNPRESH